MKRIFILAGIQFLLLKTAIIFATNYYVSNSGNDNSNNGLTIQKPFKTLQHAADVVHAGDTVFVINGTYVGFDLRDINGTSNSPIVFKAMGNNALINQHGPLRADGINIENCDYVVIDGFICNNITGDGNGIRLVTSDFCVVRNCHCNNNGRGIFTGFTDDILIEYNVCSNSYDEHGIYVSNSSDRPIIRFNECYGNVNIGIHMNGDASMGEDGIIHNAQVYGNLIHDNNLAAGLNMDGVVDAKIYNNLFYNNHYGQGIVLFQGDGAVVSHGAKIFNNTIIVPSDGRWGILLQEGANENTQIYNNIIINQHSSRGCIGVRGTTNFACDYNITNNRYCLNGDDGPIINLDAWRQAGFGTNSIIAANLTNIFENPGANNFHLKAGSQAIDKGTSLVSSVLNKDIENYKRPGGSKYDIGAYEYGSVMSVDEVKTDNLKVFPNPAKHYISITYNNSFTNFKKVELLDLNGKTIKTFSQQQWLNIESIPEGMYIVKIHLINNKILNRKIIIGQ